MLHIRIGVILSGVLALSLSFPANSAVYKCKDEYGHISYSQTICPKEANVDKIINIRGGREEGRHDLQCGLVNSFAAEVGMAVNKKETINDVYAKYGGVRGLSPTAVEIIRSVYEYQSKPFKTVQNTVEHEKERCRSEVYGIPDCSQFPVQFITSYGGCAEASDTNLRLKRLSENSSNINKLRSDNKQINQRVASATNGARQRHESQRRLVCQNSAKKAILDNKNKMRSANSASMQDRLRSERRMLKEELAKCTR